MSDSHLSNFTFSFHPQSFARALSNAISEHRLLPPRFSKPPLLSIHETTENEDADDNGRLQSDRPTKRVRTLSSAGLPTPEASPERHQAEVLWTEGWDDDLLRGQDIAKWSQYRGRSLSLSQGAQSEGGRFPPSEAGSGFQTPPPSPGAVSEYDGDLFVHGPKGGWKAIPVVPPGAEFYLSPDFEITANEDEQNVMPLVVSIGDTIGPRLLPINGPSGGDKGYFYFDPALSHITLALSDEVDQVDLYQQLATDTVEEDGKLFRYVGRFVADYRNSYLTAEDYASSTEEDQIQWLEYVYLRQPRFSVRLSRELIVEKFINSGTWFPKVHLTPVVHEVNLDDVMRSRERLLDLSIAPSEYPDDEQQIEGPTVVVRRESAPSITSPLSTLFFGSDVHSSGGTLPSFPTIPEHPGLVSPSRPPLNSRLFKETSGEHVPLPDFVRHFPLEGFEFSDVNNKAW
ncbi:hypothetical protein DL96DRAFT_920048 [Flagelloscypha sp. PMI_526]|nr:hypothetical protein DL96DRAFT_920048 [Flagelloscypha sp. PMI_526]